MEKLVKRMKKDIASIELSTSNIGKSLIRLYEKVVESRSEIRRKLAQKYPNEVLQYYFQILKEEARNNFSESLDKFAEMPKEDLYERRDAFYQLMNFIKKMEGALIDFDEVLYLTDYLRKRILIKIEKESRIQKFGLRELDLETMIEKMENGRIIITPRSSFLRGTIISLSSKDTSELDNIFVDKNSMFHIWSNAGWVNAMDDELEEPIETIEYVHGHFIARNVIRKDGNAFFMEYLCKAGFGGWVNTGLITRYCGRIIPVKEGFCFFKTPFQSIPYKTISVCKCKK